MPSPPSSTTAPSEVSRSVVSSKVRPGARGGAARRAKSTLSPWARHQVRQASRRRRRVAAPSSCGSAGALSSRERSSRSSISQRSSPARSPNSSISAGMASLSFVSTRARPTRRRTEASSSFRRRRTAGRVSARLARARMTPASARRSGSALSRAESSAGSGLAVVLRQGGQGGADFLGDAHVLGERQVIEQHGDGVRRPAAHAPA